MDLVLRAVVLYFLILLVTRVIGRRELSSLAPFDLILLIVVGDAIQQGLTQDDYSVTGAVIVVVTILMLQVATSYVSFRSSRARTVLEGEPIIILQDGTVIESTMKRERLTPEEVAEEARQQQIDSLEKVAWAVLEPSGKISFIQKQGG
jgi:uncharacterized membrane protein YcaP (DUF421 family)